MGLDTVELLVSVEDSFGIHIEDEEIAQAVTLGDLHRIVCEKIGGTPAHRCLTSAAFYRVRQAIVQTLPANRRSVRPGTRLTDLLPEAQRRERWRTIEWTSRLRFPALRHCGAIQCALLGTGVTASLAPGLASGLSSGWLALLGTAGVVAGAGLVKLTPFLAVEFPYGVETVGDLVRDVLAQNYAGLASGNGVCNDREVWATIRRLVARQTGIEEDAIVPAATPRDVGLD